MAIIMQPNTFLYILCLLDVYTACRIALNCINIKHVQLYEQEAKTFTLLNTIWAYCGGIAFRYKS